MKPRGASKAGPGQAPTSPPLPPKPPQPASNPIGIVPPPRILPGPQSIGESGLTRTLNYRGVNVPPAIIYGEVPNMGGVLMYAKVINGSLHVAWQIGWGELNAITNLRLEGQTFAFWGITTFEIKYGTPSQTFSNIIYSADGTGTWNHKLPSIAYVTAVIPPKPSGPLPDVYQFTCDVQGLKVRDPRTDATLVNRYYRTSVALCLADVMTTKKYGGRVTDAALDWAASVTSVANWHDELLSDGVTKRFTIGMVLRMSNVDLEPVIELFRSHGQMFTQYNNGKHVFIADKDVAASGLTFTDECIKTARFRVRSDEECPNHVIIKFYNQALKKDDSVEVKTAAADAGTVDLITRTYDLYGCPSVDQAERIGTWLVNRAALDKEFYLLVDARGARALPGDRVSVTSSEINVTAQDMIVTGAEPRGTQWQLTLEQYDAAIFSNVVITTVATIPPTVPSPYATPSAPTALVLTEEIYQQQSGVFDSRIRITWTPANTTVIGSFTRVKITRTYRGTTYPRYTLLETSDTVAYVQNTHDNALYLIELETVTDAGIASSAVSSSITTQNKTLPPGNVPGLFVGSDRGQVRLGWQQAYDFDLVGYEVRYTTDVTLTAGSSDAAVEAIWIASAFAANTQSLFALHQPKPGTYTYLVKAYDSGQRWSNRAAFSQITVSTGLVAAHETGTWSPGTDLGQVAPPDPHGLNWCSVQMDAGGLYMGLLEFGASGGATTQRQTAMLARALTPQQVDDYMTSNSYTALSQWDAAFQNLGLWAPLPISTSGGIAKNVTSGKTAGTNGTYGNVRRNRRGTFRMVEPRRIGVEAWQVVTIAEPQWRQDQNTAHQSGPVIWWGRNGYETGSHSFQIRLATNGAYTQSIVDVPASTNMVTWETERVPVLMQFGDTVTDANGEIIITYTAAMATAQFGRLTILVSDAAAARYEWVEKANTNTGFTIRVYDAATGLAVSGKTVRWTAEDYGDGGTVTGYAT